MTDVPPTCNHCKRSVRVVIWLAAAPPSTRPRTTGLGTRTASKKAYRAAEARNIDNCPISGLVCNSEQAKCLIYWL